MLTQELLLIVRNVDFAVHELLQCEVESQLKKISFILFRTRESLQERRKTKRSSFSSNPKRNTLALMGSAGSTVAGLATNKFFFDFAFSPLIVSLKRAIRGKVSEGSLKKLSQ